MLESRKPVFFENLDAVRAIAFGLVFFFHAFPHLGYKPSGSVEKIFSPLILNGYVGVNLFFVLSGFLITYLLLAEKENGKINILFFYIRRVLRIWPLYFMLLLVGFFIYPLLTNKFSVSDIRSHFIPFLFFLGNFEYIRTGFVGIGNDCIGVLWSVAVEEQFYLFWPVILTVTKRKYYPLVFISIILLSLVYRTVHIENEKLLYFHTFSVMSDLAIGALLAQASFYKTKLFHLLQDCSRLFIIIMYLLLFFAVYFLHTWSGYNAFTIVSARLIVSIFLAFAIGEQCFARNSLLRLGKIKSLSRAGIISYGLYCLHLFSIAIIQKINLLAGLSSATPLIFYPELIICLAITIIFAGISYYYFEKKILALRLRFVAIETR